MKNINMYIELREMKNSKIGKSILHIIIIFFNSIQFNDSIQLFNIKIVKELF